MTEKKLIYHQIPIYSVLYRQLIRICNKLNYGISSTFWHNSKVHVKRIRFPLYIPVYMKLLEFHFWNTNNAIQTQFLLILSKVYLTIVRATLVHSSPLEKQSCKMQLWFTNLHSKESHIERMEFQSRVPVAAFQPFSQFKLNSTQLILY